eukprot:6192711-Pleurochrysis_carterae.AAC.2
MHSCATVLKRQALSRAPRHSFLPAKRTSLRYLPVEWVLLSSTPALSQCSSEPSPSLSKTRLNCSISDPKDDSPLRGGRVRGDALWQRALTCPPRFESYSRSAFAPASTLDEAFARLGDSDEACRRRADVTEKLCAGRGAMECELLQLGGCSGLISALYGDPRM